MAGNIVGFVNKISGTNLGLTKAQVGNGDTTGLLGVIGEVTLSIEIGLVTDDLNSALVSTNGTVGAQTPELAADSILGLGNNSFAYGQGQIGYVVYDTNGKAVLGLISLEVLEYSKDLIGLNILGTETIAAANNHRLVVHIIVKGLHIKVEGLAESTGFLGSVKYGDLLHRLGHYIKEVLSGEGSVKVNLNNTNLFSLRSQVVNNLFTGLGGGTHGNDNTVRIGITIVIEGLVFTTGQSGDLLHVIGNDVRNGIIVRIAGLSCLEENIGVLSRTTGNRVLRIQCTISELINSFPIQKLSKFIVLKDFDFLNFSRGSETIKEVQKGNAALNCREVSNG